MKIGQHVEHVHYKDHGDVVESDGAEVTVEWTDIAEKDERDARHRHVGEWTLELDGSDARPATVRAV